METDYILGPDGELYHSGIKGMKWGIRRYQNPDGSLTPAGKKRYNKEMERLKSREKQIKGQEKAKARQAKIDAKKAELDEREKALKGDEASSKAKAKTSESSKPKSISEMSDDELRAKVMRLQNERLALDLERQIAAMTPKQVSKGEKFLKSVSDMALPAATQASKKLLTEWLEKKGAEALGLKNADELGVLKKEVEKLELQKRKTEATKYLSGKKSDDDDSKYWINKNLADKNKAEYEARVAARKKAEQDAADAKKKADQDAAQAKKKAQENAEEADRKAAKERQRAYQKQREEEAVEREAKIRYGEDYVKNVTNERDTLLREIDTRGWQQYEEWLRKNGYEFIT